MSRLAIQPNSEIRESGCSALRLAASKSQAVGKSYVQHADRPDFIFKYLEATTSHSRRIVIRGSLASFYPPAEPLIANVLALVPLLVVALQFLLLGLVVTH
jgi:hypothetical protein